MASTPPRTPPRIFSRSRRTALRQRLRLLQQRPNAARYLIEDMIEDVHERLGFLRFEPRTVLIVGDYTGDLGRAMRAAGREVTEIDPADGFDEEQPYPFGEFDLIVSSARSTPSTIFPAPSSTSAAHLRKAE